MPELMALSSPSRGTQEDSGAGVRSRFYYKPKSKSSLSLKLFIKVISALLLLGTDL